MSYLGFQPLERCPQSEECLGGETQGEDDAKFWFLLSQANHSLHEVVAKGRVEPSSTNNHSVGTCCHSKFLAFEFCRTINAVRACSLVFGIWSVVGSIEDIVGRHLYEITTTLSYCCSKIFWSLSIEQMA